MKGAVRFMKEKLLLVGAGGFGRTAVEHAVGTYDCSFVDDCYPQKKEVCGIAIVGKIADLPSLFKTYKKLVVTIGNSKLREKIYLQAKEIGFDFPNIVAASAYISPFASVGKGCVFLNNVSVQNGAQVGSGVLLNPCVEIHHDSFVEDYALIYSNSVVCTYARVGKRALIGSTVSVSVNAVVKEDEIIPDGTVRSAV